MFDRNDGHEHVLPVFGEHHVTSPMAAASELRVTRQGGDDGLWRGTGMEIAGVVGKADDGGGVGHVDIAWIDSRVEGDSEGVVEAAGEVLDLRGFAGGAYAAKNQDRASPGVSHKQVAVRRGADQSRLAESAASRRRGTVLL